MHKFKHITDKELDILRFFYEQKKGHVRQIKKATNLSEHTLLKYLESLESQKMLFHEKHGNLKLYYINNVNPLIKIFFGYFDALRLDSIEEKQKTAIHHFLGKIKEIKLPYFILLSENSSLTIFYDDFSWPIKDRLDKLAEDIFLKSNIKLDISIKKIDGLDKENMHGFPIFGSDLFYEAAG